MLKKISLSLSLLYVLLPAQSLTLLNNEIIYTNPQIQQKIHQYKSAIEDYKLSKGDYLPRIDFEATIGKESTNSASTNEKTINLTKTETSLTITENIFNGLETINLVNEKQNKALSSAFEVLKEANSIMLKTSQIYIDILKYKELVRLAKENINVHKDILQQIKQKVDVGFSPVSDLYQVQTRYSLAQTDLITQQQNLNKQITKMHKLLGRFVDIDKLSMPDTKFDIPTNIDEATLKALHNHPSIKIANLNVKIKQYAYKKIKKSYYPSLDLVLKAEKNKNTGAIEGDTDRYYAGFKLKYNLFNGLKDSKKVQNYISQIQKENQTRNIIRREVIDNIREAWIEYDSYKQKDEILIKHVDFANKAKEAYRNEFLIGKRSLLDLLDIESEYIRAKQAKVNNDFSLIYSKYNVMDKLGTLSIILGVKVDGVDFEFTNNKVANYKKDKLELDLETDKDGILDMQDICDKTIDKNITMYGCQNKPIKKVIPIETQEPKIQILNKNENENKDDDIDLIDLPPAESLDNTDQDTLTSQESTPPVVDQLQTEIKEQIENSKTTSAEKKDNIQEQIDSLSDELIYFKYKSSEINDNSLELLDKIAEILHKAPNLKLELYAYTDNIGSAKYNKRLSKRRAIIVKNYLIEQGVNPDIISVFGMGESNPIASNRTKKGRAKNRRVEFKFVGDINSNEDNDLNILEEE